jgi:hypothetical protein
MSNAPLSARTRAQATAEAYGELDDEKDDIPRTFEEGLASLVDIREYDVPYVQRGARQPTLLRCANDLTDDGFAQCASTSATAWGCGTRCCPRRARSSECHRALYPARHHPCAPAASCPSWTIRRRGPFCACWPSILRPPSCRSSSPTPRCVHDDGHADRPQRARARALRPLARSGAG